MTNRRAGQPAETGLGIGGVPDEFFRELIDAAPDAMLVVGADGRIVIVNAEAENIFGYSREQLLGQSIETLMPERFRLQHGRHRESYAKEPQPRRMGVGMAFTGLRSDGSEFPAEISLRPIKSPSGPLVVSAIRDVSGRSRIEQELETARQVAERVRKANTAFLSAASHDLRQPVQALRLLNGALRRTVTDELALEMLDSQQESLDAMTNLLNSLLDISRLDAGAFQPGIEEFPLTHMPGPDATSTGLILILEDDAQVAKAWNRLLRSENYRVAAAASIRELRSLLRQLDSTPQLVLSDYHLLDGDNGIDAVRVIRELTGTCVPAFIVTGDTSKIMQEVEKLENSRILSKPIGPDELLRLAHMAIEHGLSDDE